MKLQQFRKTYKLVDGNKLMPENTNASWYLEIKRTAKGSNVPYELIYRCESVRIDKLRLTGLLFVPGTNNKVLTGNIKAPKSSKEFFYLAYDKDKGTALIIDSGLSKAS